MTLQIGSDGSVVTTSTTITDAPAVQITGNGVQFTNSGTGRLSSSTPGSPAILIQGFGTTITNQFGGMISGNGANGIAVQGSAGTDTIVNSGTINGQVLLGDGDDSYTQRSTVGSGLRIDLQGGNDVYRHEATSTGYAQQVHGGEGYDRLQLTNYGGSIMYGDLFGGFEQLEISKSSGFWNLDGFDNYQIVLLGTGGQYNFVHSANSDADLAVSGGLLLVGRHSTFRDITGSAGTDEVRVENGTIRNADLGAGNDFFRYSQQLSVGRPTTITGIVNGGIGTDMLEITVDGGVTVDLSNFVGFETLDSGTYTGSVDNYRLINANGFASFKIGFRDTVTLAHSDLGSAPVYLALNVSLTLEATAIVGSVTLDGGSSGTAGDPTKWVNVVNSGSVVGNVSFGAGHDTLDGRLGSVGGTVYGYAGDDVLRGGSAADRLVGGFGNDRLEGNGGNDALTGEAGDDHLDGGLGSDTLRGGSGNDTYLVDAGDSVIEFLGEGTDTVQASADHQLQANVENLTLIGGAVVGTGNSLANVISGNGADNKLDGKGGADKLSGGGGNDLLIANYSGLAATLAGEAGDDDLRGNASSTIAVFAGARADYAFAVDANGKLVVRDRRDGSPDGTDTLTGIATLQFSDGAVSAEAVMPNLAPTGVELTNVVAAVAENGGSSKVADVVAVDDGRGSNNYSLAGADSAAFELRTNAAGGTELWFIASADAEARNSYQIQVQVDDPSLGEAPDASALFTLAISDVNETGVAAPVDVDGDAGGSISENATGLVNITASSTDMDATNSRTSYSLVQSDGTAALTAGNFAIDALTGVVSLTTAFDREAVGPAGEVQVTVRASSEDGSRADTTFTVTIGNLNEGVAITSASAFDMAENERVVAIVTADDLDGDAITFSLSGGADAGLFVIDALTGALSFVGAPDFEVARDANGDNVYELLVRASDGAFVEDQALSVTVRGVDEAVTISSNGGSSSATLTVSEGDLQVTQVTAEDPEGATPSFAITGGADAPLFGIDQATGHLFFREGVNFEAPADANGDNVYEVTVSAAAGGSSDSQAIRVVVANINDRPIISGGTTLSLVAPENSTFAVTIAGFDPDADPLRYSLSGNDAALFAIDAETGVLTFVGTPDFETPADLGEDNFYTVRVTASDGLLTAFQSVEITITNVNEGVTITSNPNFRVGENNTAVGMIAATDRDGDALVYSIAGGADAARFSIDGQTGAVSFVAGPDFEGAGDVDGDNSYELLIRASDGSLSDTQAVTVTVGDVNEAVRITSGASFVAKENSDLAGTIGSSDPDGDAVSYSIVGGADASRLTIDERTGILAFVAAPNFEAPSDTGGDGVYEVLVRASDGSLSDTQAVTIRVQDVNEAPAITSGGGGDAATIWTNENASAVMTAIAIDPDSAISYSIAGGADAARFTIDAATGALRFVTAANFESPSDANRDNLYELVIQASDGSLSDTQTLLVSVQNVRDGLTLNGSTKADTLAGGSAEDTINGLAGNDSLYGYAGDDIINGGDGSDRIFGDLGADTLTGGAGADTFTFSALADSSASAMDRIVDFSRWQNDKISLSAIDANSLVAGDQAFAFIGSSGFTGKAGQLRSYVSNSTTYVAGDVNGDGIADFAINLGNVTVQASDFLL